MTEVLAPPIQHICGAVQTAGSQALHNVRHVRGQVKNGLHHASKVVEKVLSPLNLRVHDSLARVSQPGLVRSFLDMLTTRTLWHEKVITPHSVCHYDT